MTTPILVSTDWLAEHLEGPTLRIYDCTTYLRPDPKNTYRVESGRAEYAAAHIPGAGFLDLQGEFSAPDPKLRFTAPGPEAFAAAAASAGISNANHLVLYSTPAPMWATRFWWLFRLFGHEQVSVLDGGFSKWQREGRPASSEPATYPKGSYLAEKPDSSRLADKDSVMAGIEDPGTCVLNALSRDQFKGDGVHYGRPGRISNSENIPWSELIDADGCFLPRATLEARLGESSALEADRVISYCGGGIAATVDLFALALLGREAQVAIYDNSLSEWATDPELPMQQG